MDNILVDFANSCVLKATEICHEAHSCAVSTITESSTATGHIQCYGYYSCAQSIISSAGPSEILCQASYSCYNAISIQQTYNDGQSIDCRGLFSYVLSIIIA